MADHPTSSQAPDAAQPQANDAAQLARGLTRKIIIAALFGGLVFAALALYGDVTKLRAAASGCAPSAVALGFVLAAGN